jgi:uncharacterized protein
MATNPFTFGALALDENFTDRHPELAGLAADLRNGQDVVIFAPRRYGKSSLVLRAAQEAIRRRVLVGYCDLMKTPTKERLAAALARTIYEDLSSPVGHALERATALFRSLRVRPTIEVDPDDATLRFSYQAIPRREDVDDTIERLLELPGEIAAERKRRVALVFDEFQEVIRIDERFPNLMRSVFQAQPEVAHVYLGSRRHLLDRIFSDRNEPFWRSAKHVELGVIEPEQFAPFLRERFAATERAITDAALDRLLAATGGHPYATQELAYFLWELVPTGEEAGVPDVEAALEQVLQSEHNHFARIWEDATENERLVLIALSEESGRLYSEGFRARHRLPSSTYIQRAVGALTREDLIARGSDGYAITEPFLADWVRREQSAAEVTSQLRAARRR